VLNCAAERDPNSRAIIQPELQFWRFQSVPQWSLMRVHQFIGRTLLIGRYSADSRTLSMKRTEVDTKALEARAGIEPTYTALQAAA
jgi:hypothetical protein